MTEVRRIDPETGFIREFKDVAARLSSLESAPAGNIVIRETLTTEDPETGVKTILGQLPDGTYGIQPFVGDITPPPVATIPVASAQPGNITVSWDGEFVGNAEKPNDFQHVNVKAHKIVTGSTVLTLTVGVIRLATEQVIITTDVLSYGETWQFSLESEDYNGNRAALSARSASVAVLSNVDDSLVGEALADLALAAQTAQDAAQAAQDAADLAQDAADDAIADALAANNLADGKGKVLIQSGTPAVADQLSQNLWIDTTGGTNTPKRWNGSAWVVVTDKVASDAAAAAGAAQGKADQAFNNAASAATTAGNAQIAADGKGRLWYQDDQPTGIGHKIGDTWFDTNDNYKQRSWNGSIWQTTQDSWLAQQTADSKGITYTQNVVPPVEARLPQNLWNDTSLGLDKIVVKYWSTTAGAWTALANKEATEARVVADSKGETIYSSTAPTVAQRLTQNLWVDTTGGININKRWDGTAWIVVADTRIASSAVAVTAADSKAQSALDEAIAKSVVYTQNTVPPVGARLPQTVWNDTSLGLDKVIVKYWNGTAWTALADKTATDAAVVADSKGETIYSTTAPAASKQLTQNLWIDTTGGININKRWDGSGWVVVADTRIASSAVAVTAAQATADAKSVVYTQNTVPPVEARLPQTVWNDTSLGLDKIVVKYWNGTAWTALADKVATDAAAVAATKTKTYFQTAQPSSTGNTTGDLWFDTDDNNKTYVWDGAAWTVAQDATINKSIFGTFSTDIDQTQPNKWLYTRYDKTGLVNTQVPSYLDIVGLAGTSSLIADGAQLVVNVGDQYIGQLRTIVNIASSKTIAVTATHDDGAQIYVDGVSVYTKNTYTAGAAISFSISAGWHVIDMLWLEQTGGDGFSNISPTFGSQFTSMFAPVSLTATSQAVSAAQTSANTAMAAQSYSTNASFDDWTSTHPAGYTSWSSSTPIKETTLVRRAPYAARFTVADATTQSGMAFSSILAHAPNIEYFTVELEFQLVSGTLASAGFLLDWTGLTNNRVQFNLANEIANPILGKWYRVTKVLRRPTNSSGTWTSMSGYLMCQYSGLGTGAAKSIVFDWMNVRPSTTEEITSYGTPASIQVVTDLATSKGEVIYSDTAPVVAKQLTQNLWIDTTGGININKRWDGSGWVVVADTRIASSAAAVTAADGKAQSALDAAIAKGRTYTQSTVPPVEARLPQNLWIDISAGASLSVTKYWDATANAGAGAWVPVADAGISTAQTAAALDATTKANAAAAAAINAQAYSLNASFDDWTASIPNGYTQWSGSTPVKETTLTKRAPYALRWNVPDATTQQGVQFTTTLAHAPNVEFYTVEVDLYLVSGTLAGTGVILDWNGMTNNRSTITFTQEITAPITGKWYRVSKVLRRPTNATGTWTSMGGYLMGQWSSFGTGAAKNVIYDWLNVRPSTVEEILAYTAPTTTYVDQAETDAITTAGTNADGKITAATPGILTTAAATAQTKATQALTDAINDTTTKLLGKNKVVWSTSAASGTGYIAGDTWYQRDGTGAVIAQWEFTTSWQSRIISEAAIGNLSAGKLVSGVIDAGLIGANTITVDKLLVGDFTNLVDDPLIVGVGWTTVGSPTIPVTTGAPGPSFLFTGTAAAKSATNKNKFSTTAGDKYYASARVQNSTNAATYFRVSWFDSSNVFISSSDITFGAATAWTTTSAEFTAPALASTGQMSFVVTTASTSSSVWFAKPIMRRKNGGELIVDGAIDGKLITGATIQTEVTASRGIKLTGTELAGYDGAGVKNFSLTTGGTLAIKGAIQSGSTITGATLTGAGIETTATAARGVKIASTGITTYDSVGNMTFKVDAATGLVEAPGLKANTITGTMISGQTISTDKLLVMSMDNLISEPTFLADGISWTNAGAYSIDPTGARNGGPAWKIANAASQQGVYNKPDKIPAEGGQAYRLTAWVKSDVAIPLNGISLYITTRNAAGTASTSVAVGGNSAATSANTWVQITGTRTLPADAINVSFGVFKQSLFTTGNVWVDFVSATRMSGGELIVDGAIDGKLITGATIQTETTANRGIKLTSAELAGYDGAGVKNLSLTSAGVLTLKGAIQSGSTITGAAIVGGSVETSATALSGVKMTSTGIKAYDSGNNLTFHLDSTTGLLEIPGIKTNSLTGDKIVSGSITAEQVRIGDFTNHVTNGFGDLGAGKGFGTSLIYDTVDKPAGVTGVFKSTAGQSTYIPPTILFDVAPNTEYITEIWLKASLPNSKIFVELRDQAGGHGTTNVFADTGASEAGYPLNSELVPTTWTKFTLITTTLSTTTRLKIGSIYFNHTNGTEQNAVVSIAISFRRRLAGNLLVDGAIDGKVITGPTIQTETTANRGIKLTSAELAGYDGAGVKNLSLTSAGVLTLKGAIQSGSTITGATLTGAGIETTATALRGVKLTSTGITTYDGSGNMTFKVDATTGLVEAPGLKANTIKGDMIDAGTISASKLIIGAGDNLIPDPGYQVANVTAMRSTNSTMTVTKNVTTGNLDLVLPGTGNYYFRATGIAQTAAAFADWIPVSPGETYLFASTATTGGTGDIRLTGRTKDGVATSIAFSTLSAYPAIVSGVRTVYKATVPADAYWMLPEIRFSGWIGTATIAPNAMSLRSMTSGEIIVDGAIDGKLITGATVQTSTGATTGIKLTPTELAGWDGTNKNFSLTSAGALTVKGNIQSGSTIEGARITGTSGLETSNTANTGVKITNTGIKAYDAGNNLSFHLDATTGFLEVPGLKANSITGGLVAADTITVKNLAITDLTNIAYGGEFNDPSALLNWNVPSRMTYQTVDKYSGAGAIKIIASGTAQTAYATEVAVQPLDQFTVEFYYKTTSDYATTTNSKLRITDQIGGATATFTYATANTSWTKVSGEFTIPASGVTSFSPDLWFYHTVGTLWIDSLIIRKKVGATLIEDDAIKTAHITTDTLDGGVIKAGTLKATKIESKSIGVDQLTISSSDNLVVESAFESTLTPGINWTRGTNQIIQVAGGRDGANAMRLTGTVSINYTYNLNNKVQVDDDSRFRVTMWVRSNVLLSSDKLRFGVKPYKGTTVLSNIALFRNSSVSTSANYVPTGNVWTKIEGVTDPLPVGTTAVEWFVNCTSPSTTATIDIDSVSVTRVGYGTLIVDGSITAKKLTSDLILATKIIAGDPTGTYAEMSPRGFIVYADSPTATAASPEVIRLGVADTNDYFAITKADGTLAASISENGVGSFEQMNVDSYSATASTGGLWVGGTEISSILDKYPRGPLYKAELSADIDNITTEYGLVEAEYICDGQDRQIRLSCGVRFAPTSQSSEVYLKVRYTIDGSAPTINSPYIFDVALGVVSLTTYDHKSFMHTIRPTTMNGGLAGPSAVGKRVRLLMTVARGNGDSLKVRQGLSSYLHVEDMGKGVPHTPGFSPGGGSNPAPPPPVPAKLNYVKQYGAWNSMNYDGNNNQYNWDLGHMYQGLSPAGYGNTKSMCLFDRAAIQADLSGASINYVRVYFYFAHWYYNSGGTARIGVHSNTGIPGTFTGMGPLSVISGGWPKPGARWVDLPGGHWEGWKNSYGGLYLEGDGGYGTYGYSDRPTLEIGYSK